jgi:hypothetical protein
MQMWCVDCGRASPDTDGLYTLSAEGWRPMRSGPDFEWRCPDCWLVFREAREDARASSSHFRAAAPIPSSRPPASSSPASLTEESRRVPAEPLDLLIESGERWVTRGADDTQEDSRSSMIARTLRAIFDMLKGAPPTPRARELYAQAARYQAFVAHWRALRPTDAEQVEAFARIAELHATVHAFVVARERMAR